MGRFDGARASHKGQGKEEECAGRCSQINDAKTRLAEGESEVLTRTQKSSKHMLIGTWLLFIVSRPQQPPFVVDSDKADLLWLTSARRTRYSRMGERITYERHTNRNDK